ncbi:MAG: hypothetical protein CMK00_00645 [Planctomycetes bacterium]|nr:hypothetical protein [Planctomycetota bacterium]
MQGARIYKSLYGASLVTLTLLGAWWMVFFLRSVENEHAAARAALEHEARLVAWDLARSPGVPAQVPDASGVAGLSGQPAVTGNFVVLPSTDLPPGTFALELGDAHPGLSLTLAPSALTALGERFARRRLMVIGESSLLIFLIVIFGLMLIHLLMRERQHRARMEDFVATMSHEMKTPLAGLKSMLQTFSRGGVPPEQAGTLFAMGLKETERLEHMVENVLLSGQLRTRTFELGMQAISLRPLLADFLEHRCSYLVGSTDDIVLAFEPAALEPTVLADPRALAVILDNLCDNAAKYGGSPAHTSISVHAAPGGCAVNVEDRGIGFAPEQAPRLFEPFRRGLRARAQVQHGTGLGLAISASLAIQMGGALTAHSDGPGQGSCFTLTLQGTAPARTP